MIPESEELADLTARQAAAGDEPSSCRLCRGSIPARVERGRFGRHGALRAGPRDIAVLTLGGASSGITTTRSSMRARSDWMERPRDVRRSLQQGARGASRAPVEPGDTSEVFTLYGRDADSGRRHRRSRTRAPAGADPASQSSRRVPALRDAGGDGRTISTGLETRWIEGRGAQGRGRRVVPRRAASPRCRCGEDPATAYMADAGASASPNDVR